MNRRSFLQYLSAVAAWFGFGVKPVAAAIPPPVVAKAAPVCLISRVTGYSSVGGTWVTEQRLEPGEVLAFPPDGWRHWHLTAVAQPSPLAAPPTGLDNRTGVG